MRESSAELSRFAISSAFQLCSQWVHTRVSQNLTSRTTSDTLQSELVAVSQFLDDSRGKPLGLRRLRGKPLCAGRCRGKTFERAEEIGRASWRERVCQYV